MLGVQHRDVRASALVDLDGDRDLDLLLLRWPVGESAHRPLPRQGARWTALVNDGSGELANAGTVEVGAPQSLHAPHAPHEPHEPGEPGEVADFAGWDWADWDGDGDADAAALSIENQRPVLFRLDPGPRLVPLSLPGVAGPVAQTLWLGWIARPEGTELRAVWSRGPAGETAWTSWSHWSEDGPARVDHGTSERSVWERVAWDRVQQPVAWADVNGDGRLDALLAPGDALGFGDSAPIHLLVDDGEGHLTDRTADAGLERTEASGVVRFGASRPPRLILMGHGFPDDQSPLPQLLAWDADGSCHVESLDFRSDVPHVSNGSCQVGDIDADGDLDLYLQGAINMPSSIAWNDGDGRFHSEPIELGPGGQGGVHAKLGDLDGDGDLDVYVDTVIHPGFLIITGRR